MPSAERAGLAGSAPNSGSPPLSRLHEIEIARPVPFTQNNGGVAVTSSNGQPCASDKTAARRSTSEISWENSRIAGATGHFAARSAKRPRRQGEKSECRLTDRQNASERAHRL